MWELFKFTPLRVKSLRRIFIFCQAAIVASFSLAIISTTMTSALTATWSSTSTISYDGDTYRGPIDDNLKTKLELDNENVGYTSVDPISVDQTRKIHVIFFDSQSVIADASTANYKTFTYLGPQSFESPSTVSSITIDKQSESSISNTGSSCSIAGGLGWIICPVTNFLASGMDWIFDVIKGFLVVRPVMTAQENALYRTWSYVRSIANIAFVIAFLIIIYSQLTSMGISNYGIKKLLPRLIVAAILVNISYSICAVLIDLSNIVGFSIQDVMISIRNSVTGVEGNSWELTSWESISGFILSGGALATGGSIALYTTLTTYGVAGSIFLLLPTLVAGILAVLVALVILSARQALVTILVILSPLAFVAYLLPNTEKWFERWKSTLSTMLMLFPIISILFGGSQLASAIIIQNADSINTLLLGMIIQVVPLFVMPLLIKLSGSVVGKVAGIVNDVNKGPLDRTKNFTNDRAELRKARRLSDAPKPREFLRKRAQIDDHKRRRREALKGSYGSATDARWANSNDFSDIDQSTRESQERKAFGESQSELRYTSQKLVDGKIQDLDIRLREVKLKTDSAKLSADKNWEVNGTENITAVKLKARVISDELSAAKLDNDNLYSLQQTKKYYDSKVNSTPAETLAMMMRARSASESLAIQSMRKQSVERVKGIELADSLVMNKVNRELAGANEINDHGADSAYAAALSTIHESYAKVVKDRTSLMAHFNLSASDYQAAALSGKVATDANGNKLYNANGTAIINRQDKITAETKTSDGTIITYDFDTNDEYNKEAAIARQLKIGLYTEKRDIIEESGVGGSLHKYASSIANGMASSDIGSKAPHMGGGTINTAAQGKFEGHKTTLLQAANFIGDGKFKAEDIANTDTLALIDMIDAFKKGHAGQLYDNSADGQLKLQRLQKYSQQFYTVAYDILNKENNVGNNASGGTKKELYRLLKDAGRPLPEKIDSLED